MQPKSKENDIDKLIETTIGQFNGTETDDDLRYVTDKWLELKKYQYGDFINSSISLLALFTAIIALLIATHLLSNVVIVVVFLSSSSLSIIYVIATRKFPSETDKALRTYVEMQKLGKT